ncbi:lysM and putative peptidoglycan-binding domain-containing protein 3-like [Babylonia areolata]|uniref:lysM and putative peptidoglycan-binding domain-containing protein 3-like n=1 Tax=Babylonia areolata TaxID=304850 RepID=UPI003FD09EAE
MSAHSHPFAKGREVSSRPPHSSKGQIQNVKAARVYVFGDSDIVENDGGDVAEFEMPEIRSRRGQNGCAGSSSVSAQEEEAFFEKEISDGETLQSLSLKYACPMSELKRVNKLIKDQDFFALRVLKIPLRRHGYLAEMVKQELNEAPKHRPHTFSHREPITSDSDVPSDALCSDVDFSDPETQIRIMRTVSIRDNFSRQGREANRFLKKMDKDLAKLRQSTVTDRESLDEVVSVLTKTRIQPLEKERSDGADCGLTWWKVVGVAFLVAVLVPATYFIYITFFMDTKQGS